MSDFLLFFVVNLVTTSFKENGTGIYHFAKKPF